MSYFDLPRLHVSGKFYTDPSSMNNDPNHYLSDTTRPAPWQMPHGRHYFRFHDCQVMSAYNLKGDLIDNDPLIGAEFRTTDEPVPAKIVDLDVYQQATTGLFGLEIVIKDAQGHQIKGKMDTPVLNGNSFNFVQPTRGWKIQYGDGSYGGDSNAIGVFQNVIRVPEKEWAFPADSAMGTLKGQCQTETLDGVTYVLLSFRFLLDGYWNVAGSIDYQNGRMTGTIGPMKADDPAETPGARWLEARPKPDNAEWYVPFFYRAPFQLDQTLNRLRVDWSGSVSRLTVGGEPAVLGQVEAKVVTDQGSETLGTLLIDAPTYLMRGGVSEIALTAEQTAKLASNPLELWSSRDDIGPQRIFFEAADGVAMCTQNRAFRMSSNPDNPLSQATARVHITKFGAAQAGLTPKFKIIPVSGTTPGITVPPGYPGDTAQADGALAAKVSESDANGFATVTFSAVKDPGSRTTELDGQLYFCYAYFGDEEPWKEPRQEQQISVILWSLHEVIAKPAWEDVKQMMIPYAKLYPAMTEKFDLADQTAFNFYANNPGAPFFMGPGGKFDIPGHPEIQNGAIPLYISLPIEDPRFMPVTRDLSSDKIKTILNYIGNEQKKIQQKLDQDEKPPKAAGTGETS